LYMPDHQAVSSKEPYSAKPPANGVGVLCCLCGALLGISTKPMRPESWIDPQARRAVNSEDTRTNSKMNEIDVT
jgi:hypothetical protein